MLSFEPRSLGENPGEVTELYRILLVGGSSQPHGEACYKHSIWTNM